MLDHIGDLRKITNKDMDNLVSIFNKSFSIAVDNSRYRSAIEISLLLDIAQSLRDLNKRLKD
jgi:hypothetical protein